ncbi:MAG: TROVE domain-containing protein [Ruminococcus sp.]|nr:TROVE domain-containing protein [Ruminococcus sp.]
MAKFNSTPTMRTTNKCGHAAYKMRDKEKLVTQVLTSFFNEKKFYGDNSKEMQETIKSVIKTDPQFVANLAVFARREFNMRSVAHVLTAYLAHEIEGKPFTRSTIKGVSLRGDDVTEIMACYLSMFGKPIPNAMKKGISDVLQGFDEYTLAKYKGNGKEVKMRDLICLCRPTPKDKEQSEMWNRLLNGKLETPYTWETELSEKGNNKETWEALIDSGKVGYMALLRNLRNILQANPSNVNKVLETIENPAAVKRSKQLPFRYLSAYKELEHIGGSRVFDCLENAVESSCENIGKIPGTTVIAVDISGSMGDTISEKSNVRCYEIAMLLGLIANKICENSIFYVFNSKIEKYSLSKRNGILYTVTNSSCLGGTAMHLPFQKMLDDKVQADRIIILSDNQCNSTMNPVQNYADQYRKISGSGLWVHAIDLQGYGTQQFCGKHTNIIAGWSEKVFDFIRLAEQGEGTLEKAIEQYTF